MPCPQITLSFPPHLKLESITLETGLFINNQFVESAGKGTFETINPTNGKVIGSVSEAKAEDVDIAVKAASEAFDKVWGLKTPGALRGKMLMHLADKIEANLSTFAVYIGGLPVGFTGLVKLDLQAVKLIFRWENGFTSL
ncbi:aldehyde dehydrogenase (NAD(P)(+)) ald5 [Puccinia graminis f. sp. tritici]|uniref:Aldehyde dehydrogenase (NAD(P)(+)) ald5 n=1 Tax=Puccinia graminis f. sp. tritici TaxID=56615 RepID=A0A5B0SLI2_PUCGR|nr:aldehyde dehydrogenase (NAD(P)(+)) ald5 [Puccinia graminis f. sp. tritici]